MPENGDTAKKGRGGKDTDDGEHRSFLGGDVHTTETWESPPSRTHLYLSVFIFPIGNFNDLKCGFLARINKSPSKFPPKPSSDHSRVLSASKEKALVAGTACVPASLLKFCVNALASPSGYRFHTKFLGMFLDRGLTWNDHVDSICVTSCVWIKTLGILICALISGRDVHQYETRGRDNLRTHQRRLTSQHIPQQVGVRLINKLPEDIKNSNNLNQFKTRLRRLLVSKAFYSIDEFMTSRWDD
ncbi:hypothetical protein J6590_050947 [Homalodisca vitripennis]|nr:hypothetical protein J6590_050947 [Homalodisca vitripennis]